MTPIIDLLPLFRPLKVDLPKRTLSIQDRSSSYLQCHFEFAFLRKVWPNLSLSFVLFTELPQIIGSTSQFAVSGQHCLSQEILFLSWAWGSISALHRQVVRSPPCSNSKTSSYFADSSTNRLHLYSFFGCSKMCQIVANLSVIDCEACLNFAINALLCGCCAALISYDGICSKLDCNFG